MLGIALIQNRVRSVLFWFFSAAYFYGVSLLIDVRSVPTSLREKAIQVLLMFPFYWIVIAGLRESTAAYRRAQLLGAARHLNGKPLVVVGPYGRPEGDLPRVNAKATDKP